MIEGAQIESGLTRAQTEGHREQGPEKIPNVGVEEKCHTDPGEQ